MFRKYKDLIFVLLLLFCGIFCRSELLVDRTLSPRFLSTFILLPVIFVFSYKKLLQYLSKGLNIIDILLTAFSAWQLISITWSTNTAEAFGDSSKAVAFLFVYFYFRSLLLSNSDWKKKLPLLLSLVSFVYLIVVWAEIIKLGDSYGINAQSLYLLKYPSGHKNLISIFLLVSLSFQFIVLQEKRLWKKIFALSNIAAVTFSLFVLSTRSVSVGMMAVALFFFALTALKKINLKRGLTIALAIFLIALSHWFFAAKYKEISLKSYYETEFQDEASQAARTDRQQKASVNERLILWKQTVQLISEKPIAGVGAGNWKIEFPKNGYNGLIRAEFYNTTFNRPHNDFLWILSEFGIIGFLLYLSILFFVVRNAWQRNWYNYIMMAGLLAYLAVSFFDFPRERSEHRLLFAALLALTTHPWHSKAFKLKKAKIVFAAAFVFVGLGIIVYSYRIQGEKAYVELRNTKEQKNFPKVIKLATKAENVFYTSDFLNFPLRWYSAISYTYMGNFKTGEKEFRKALELNPTNFHTLNNLGYCLAVQKKYTEAIPFLQRALEINRHFEDSRFNLSYCFMMNGQYSEAVKVLEYNISNSEKKNAYLDQIKKLQNNKKPDHASGKKP